MIFEAWGAGERSITMTSCLKISRGLAMGTCVNLSHTAWRKGVCKTQQPSYEMMQINLPVMIRNIYQQTTASPQNQEGSEYIICFIAAQNYPRSTDS